MTSWTTVTGSSTASTGATGNTITLTNPAGAYAPGNIQTITMTGGGGGGSGTYYTSTGAGSTWTTTPNTTITTPTITLGKGGKPVLSTEKNEINLDELADFVKTMQERMCILIPAFEKHEQYEALKKAYDNYKMIEALLQEEPTDDK